MRKLRSYRISVFDFDGTIVDGEGKAGFEVINAKVF
jgi:hypothetical protein